MYGLLPCAGTATRIHGLPKFLLPVLDGYLLDWHCRQMKAAGVERILIGTNDLNYDLVWYYTDGDGVYIAKQRDTMTQTVLSAEVPANAPVLFGMPDTLWTAKDVYHDLTKALQDEASVAVALFKARPGQHTSGGMCAVDGDQITKVEDKPLQTGLRWIWGAMAWQPRFLQRYARPEDPHVGFALPRAIADGVDVRAVFCEGEFYDCGTSERYFECIRATTAEREAI